MKMNLLGKSDANYEISETELEILTSLSTDAERPVADLVRELEMSTTSVEYHIKKLENKYDIKYILEIPVTTAFKFSRFSITIKFAAKRPNLEEIKAILLKEAFVQLAVATKGDYDLLIVILVEGTVDLGKKLYKLRNEETFSNYNSIWNVCPISSTGVGYGFMLKRRVHRLFESACLA